MLGRKNIKLRREKFYDKKQVYGLKKLSIGTVSVLLGMTFIAFDNHTVSANTTDAVQESESTNSSATSIQKKALTLKTSATPTSDVSTADTTSTSSSTTNNATNNEASATSTATSTATTSTSEESTSNQNNQVSNYTTVELENNATMNSAENLDENKATSSMQNGTRPVTIPTHTTTSSTDVNGFILSINRTTVGNDGDAGKDLNIVLTGTFQPGDIYTIKVPVTSLGINDSAFTPEKLGGRAEVVNSDEIIDGEKYKVYKVISSGSYTVTDGLRIVVPDGNNYAGQPNVNSSNHLDPNGPIKRQIFWSYQNSDDPSKVINNYPLEFTSTVQTSMAPTIRQVKPDPKYVKNLRVDTRYDFEIDINQPTGVGENGYTSNKVNNAQNLGTTITVPVPGNFLLDPQASMDASKLGSNSGVTFTQDKAGGDVIITIPAGSGSQFYQYDTGYHLVGKFIQTIEPFGKRDYSANGLITVDQKIRTTDGEKDLTAQVNNPWTVTLVGPKFTPQDGQFEVVIAGNNTAKQFTQSQPTRVVNYFGFQNSTAISYTNSLHIDAAFPDGLDVTGIKTPGINNTMRPGTTSYAYNIETKSGKILSGVVNAGETILAPTGEYILKVDIIPNYVEVGASTKYGDAVDNIIKDNIGNRQADDPDIFEALGTLSDAMNTMAVIPPDTVLTTKLVVFSPDFNNNTYYTLSIDQKVQGLDQLKASIGAWRYQDHTMYNPKNTNPNYYGKFDTHWYGTGYTTDRIYEPIIYYVLPKYFSYSRGWDGVQLKTTDDSGKVVVPKYSTYVVDGRQVIKFDYTGTGYSLYTRNESTNQIFIMMDPDAVAGKYPYDVYMYTRTGLINYNTKYTNSNVTDLVNQYTGNVMTSNIPGSLYKLNTIYGNNFVVDKQIITYVPVTSQGNQNPKSVLVGTSDDKGDNTLSYYLNIANYDSNDLSAARLLINLPQKSDGASSYDVHLSGPIVYDKSYGNLSDDAYTILYSTNTQNLPSSSVKGTQTSLEGYVPADQVTDWSQIKSIIVVFNESIPSQDYVGRFIVKGTDPTFKEDAGKIGYIKAALTGDNFSPFTVNNSGIKIQGTSTVTARLHYQDENGVDKYIDIPAMTKTYSDNVDTLKSSDFSASSVPADMIPKGYEVSGSPQLIIINKDDVNNAAKFNSLVKYYFDGDIVQFELSEIVTTETKKVTQNVYYIYDSSSAKYQAGGTNLDNAIVVNGQKVSPTTVTYTVTRKTHQASGKKEYIVVNDKTGEALTVDSNGNFVIPGVTAIPSLPGYTANGLDVTNAQSNTNFNIDNQFLANTGSEIDLNKTIAYTPNSQNLSYRMYNMTQKKWIADNPIPFMTGKTDDTVTGGIDAFDKKIHDFLIPSAYILNRVNYYDATTGNFVDFTDEPGTEGNYVLKVPANFSSDNSKNIITLYVSDPISCSAENKVVTRTITYHDKDENNALINTANANINKDTYPDTTTDTITFTRYKVIDQVTENFLGYYKPSQMESVNGKLVPKAGEDYIPYTSDTANASSAFEILVNGAYTTSAKFGDVTPYDLTKYGYQPAVDMNGNTLTIITGRTVQVTTSNFEEHVFYKHQWANINPNTKPQEGQKVDSTDPNSPVYPKNSYDSEDSISTVNRIIHYVYAIGTKIDGVDVSRKPVNGLSDTIQMITYYQDAQIDLVTGNINYLGTWKAVKSEITQNGVTTIIPNYNQFTAVTSPKIDNYKPVQSTIDALTPNRHDKTLDVYVIYVPNTTSVVVNYLDQDNANGVIFAKTLNGSHGDKIDYTTTDEIKTLEQKGYELVDDGFTDQTGDKYYDSSKSQIWTVLLKHKKVVITADDPHSSDEKLTIPDGYQHNYPSGISEQDLNTTVSREIDFKYNQGVYRNGTDVSGQQAVDDNGNLIENVVQKVPYVRTATIDLVKLADNNQANTAVTYSDWVAKDGGSGDFASFTVPEIKGYHASMPIVPEVTPIKDIQGKPQNAKNLTVLYDAEDRTIEIVFVDGDGNVVEPQYPITGKTGETVPITDGKGNPIKPPMGWKYKYPDDPDKVVPGTITLTPDGMPELKIPIEHTTVRVDPNDPHEANTGENPDNSIRPYPAGVDKDDLNHTVTRTIIVHMPDGTTREKKQELLFQRWATVDELNGHVTYDPWLPKNGTTFESVQAEDIVATPSGYTPGQGAPMVEGITEESEDSTFDIVYTPNDQHAVLRIVDKDVTVNGEPKEIFTTSATGKYGTIINFADLDNELNDLKSKNYQVENNFNKETKYQADDTNNEFIIYLSHKKIIVGGGVAVREKISYFYVDSEGNKHPIADDYITDVGSRVVFTQTGMLDLVTGEYTWNHDWKIENNKFDTVASPNIQGYVIRQGMEEVPAQTVAISEDGTITIKDDKLGGKISRVSSDGSTATYFVSYEMYYDAADQKTTVTYVDDDLAGKVVGSIREITGKTFETVKTNITNPDKDKYEIVNEDQIPNEIVFGTNGYPAITVHLKHGTHPIDEHHTITQTVHYIATDHAGVPDDHTVSVQFDRDGYNDEVTGDDHWNAWKQGSTQTFAEVPTPKKAGYTPDKPSVPATVVHPFDHNQTIDVTYTPDTQKVIVTFIDDTDNGKALKTITKTGPTNSKAGYTTVDDINMYKGQHYVLVSDQTHGQSITFDTDTNADQRYEVHLKHGTHPINDHRTITETVHYKMTDGTTAPADYTAKIEFSRDGFNDEVTSSDHWNAWTPSATHQFDAVHSPEVKGYTPNTDQINAVTVNPDSQSIERTVTYTPDAQKLDVTFIDDTTGETLKTVVKNGVTNADANYSTKSDIQNYESQHYILVSDSSNGAELVFDNDDAVDQHYEVHLKHATHVINEHHAINETVHYTVADGSKVPADHTANVQFDRDGFNDEVTGTDHWNAWRQGDTQTFAGVLTPVKKGYTPDIQLVDAITVNPTDQDIKRTVTYTPDAQKLDVTFIDDTTGEALKTVVKNGVTNADANYSTKSDIQNYESQHYVLVSDSSNGAELVFDNDDAVDQHYEVHLKHATHAIDEHHVINETVHYKMSDGTKAPDYYQAEALSFSRDGFNDEVTGIDHWNAWAPKAEQTFGKVVSPLVAGYTPDIDQINTQTVKPTDHDLEFTVTYTPNVQIAHVKYIDDTDHKVLTQDDLNGRTGETSGYHTTDRITEFKGQHYVFVSDNYPATGMTFDNNDRFDQIYEVHFKHGTRTDEQDVQVPRTIKYVYQNSQQAQPDHSDALKFHETKVVDLVDGHTVSDDWTPAQDFETVMTPEIQGYTPDHASVANTGIAHDHSAIVETVTYNPDAQKAVVKYIDDTTGEQLEAKDLAGVSDQSTGYTTKETIDGYINQHYVLVSDGTHGETVVFDHDDDADQSYEVHLKHGTEPANESRIKKITVHYQYADGLARSGKAADDQTATNLTFKRTGTHDLVTDKIAWNAWNHADQTFSAIDSPAIQGYTPDRTVVDNVKVNPDSHDLTEVTVTYTADAQKLTVNFIDDTTGKTLKTIDKIGHSDESADYDTKSDIQDFISKHYDLISDQTNGENLVFDHDDNINQHYEVHLSHHTHQINEQHTITETVHYQYADGLARSGKAVDDFNALPLSFSRDGFNDEVTGVDHWNAWTPADQQTFTAVQSPVI
ncbi:YSIRK-type signal peptide-containing protein, partial [Ligilactobacillus salivarius]|uniref:mucin-binding protein n=1 Tax=Ligilactobacillus salivarius TaxID=1624 RepID=UPI0025A4B66B